MQTVLIVIHLLIVIALVGVVLIQRSEGGGLGVGGGSGFMTARGTKNALTRVTAILAACFFIMSIILVIVNAVSNPASDILERIPSAAGQKPSAAGSAEPTPANQTTDDVMKGLGGPASDKSATPEQQTSPVPQPVSPVPSGN